MTSFGWKRKAGDKVCKSSVQTFEKNAKDDGAEEEINSGDVDWLTLAPKRRVIQLEDGIAKSQRLKEEGTILAESERFWEALKKWDDAVNFTPEDASLYEMKAQAYMCLGELYPAISAARKAVELEPTWWVAHQTLGRAHLNLGEVRIAIKCFSRAVHIYPAEETLWTDDLQWAHSLLERKKAVMAETQKVIEEETTCKIVELDEDGQCKDIVPFKGKEGSLDTKLLHMDNKLEQTTDLKFMKQNYVVMRD